MRTIAQIVYWQLVGCMRWAPGRIVTEDYYKLTVEPQSVIAIQVADDTERAIRGIMRILPKRL
jgi:hypothetical protein